MFAWKLSNRWPALAATLLLAGCVSTPAPVVNYSLGSSGQPPPGKGPGHGVETFGLGGHANGTVSAAGYTVARGDTLYSIAFANGTDVRELASLNDIPPPYVIHPGQVLKLHRPVAAGATVTMGTPPASQPSTNAQSAQPATPVFGPVTAQPMGANGVAPAGAVAPTVAVRSPPPAAVAAAPRQPAVTPPPPEPTRSVAGITWQWPAGGKVIGSFSREGGGEGAGINIAGKLGDPVRAAAAGTVVYSGDGLIGYGELVIVKQNDTYLSAYGHNSKRLVQEGAHVRAGQEIALMGASGAPRVELHFEIRKDGKPVDPMSYLPKR